jgi:VWFA-related protein
MLAFSCLAGHGQDAKPEAAPNGPETLHVTSRLVVLDVVVTDHQGNVRTNLTKDDFHVTENGVPQTLLSFEPPSAHVVPAPGPGDLPITSTADLEKRAPQSPVNVIVLDEMNTAFTDMAFARYALKKYLNAGPGQALPPTMLAAINFNKFTVLHDYTQDRKAILDALDHHLTHYPMELQRGESPIIMFAKSIGALEQVAQGTAGHPGHKNVIWVGKGFRGINLSSPAIPQNTVIGVTYATQTLMNMLRDSRITLYTVDPTILSSTISTTVDQDSVMGVGDSMDATPPDPFDGDVNFSLIAKESGGKAYYSRNDVDREIGESVRNGENFYTISYRPSGDSDADKPFRKIRVEFAMKGLHASYRDGYYSKDNAVPPPTSGRTTYDLAAAEQSRMVYTGLSVQAIAKPGATDTYLVGVPQHELTWTPDGDTETAKLSVIAAAVNNKDQVMRRAVSEVTARRPAGGGPNPDTALAKVEISLPATPNTYRLRFVVRGDGDGKLGTADIKIPGAPEGKNER